MAIFPGPGPFFQHKTEDGECPLGHTRLDLGSLSLTRQAMQMQRTTRLPNEPDQLLSIKPADLILIQIPWPGTTGTHVARSDLDLAFPRAAHTKPHFDLFTILLALNPLSRCGPSLPVASGLCRITHWSPVIRRPHALP